jgi:hypothetical protein
MTLPNKIKETDMSESSPARAIDAMFASVVGQQIYGGCEACEAYQTVRNDHGFWRLTVHHDEGCPTLERFRRRAG